MQIGIVPDTLPHTGFQIFRQPGRTLLAMSPFRLGGEPNVRVGVAMITSAADGVSLHEAALQEMWNRSLKGERAAHFLHQLLENEGKPLDADQLPRPDDGSGAGPSRCIDGTPGFFRAATRLTAPLELFPHDLRRPCGRHSGARAQRGNPESSKHRR